MSALALRVATAALALGAIVSCDAPRPPLDDAAPTAPRVGLGELDVEILQPREPAGSDRVDVPGDGFTIRWRPIEDPSRSPVVGYQLKAILAGSDTEPPEVIATYLTDGEDPLEWSPLRRPNHLIPDHLVVEEPDSPGEPYPPLVGSFLYFETQWWPHRNVPREETSLFVDRLDPGRYAFAVRAVHEDGSVTAVEDYAFASASTRGNLVRMTVHPPDAIPSLVVRINEGPPATFTESGRWTVDYFRTFPLNLEWDVEVGYGRGEGPSRFRLDCASCPSGDGINEWSDWGHWSSPIEVAIPSEELGRTVALTIQAQDDRQDPAHQIEAGLDLVIVEPPFDRTALLVDDFKVSGYTDCEHDAFVIPLVEQAVASHLEPGELLDIWVGHEPTGPCQERSIPNEPDLATFLRYRTIYWVVAPAGQGSVAGLATHPTGDFGRTLHTYVRLGGNLVVWGRATLPALLGDYYPPAPLTPDTPEWKDPNFGPGSFVYDVMHLRYQFDRTGRGVIPELSLRCSGLVGFERTPDGATLGLPEGIPDPTGVLDRTGFWYNRYEGADNHAAPVMVASTAGQTWDVPYVRPLYTTIANGATWSDPIDACGEVGASPLHEQPIVVAIDPPDALGKIVWFGGTFYTFDDGAGNLVPLLRGLTDWVFAE